MEKLKAKHDHKLTDILKVFIFGLFLIMPFLVFAPSLLYISFNPNAQAEQTTINVDEYKQVDFNQLIKNGDFENTNYWTTYSTDASLNINNHIATLTTNVDRTSSFYNGSMLQKFDYYMPINHIYLIRFEAWSNDYYSIYFDDFGNGSNFTIDTTPTVYELYFTLNNDRSDQILFIPSINAHQYVGYSVNFKNINCFDLTQMFGAGNEPTKQQFDTWYPNNYYDYTLSKPEVIKIGTNTETIQDVETQIANNWQQMWNKQIFKWTNETILYKGINAFSQTFGIFDNSYITNLITYELIIVMIYIVIDIILTMFKWLTHMIGEK